MRIGELAALAGVTTRAVRHYHRRGLLPEPPRRSNGYRVYGLRDVLILARVKRLTDLGLSLDEVRDVLADGTGRDFREILLELDGDLAQQEARIRDRRARLATLLTGVPADEDPVSPDLASLLEVIGRQPDSPMAEKERKLLALLDTSPDRDRVLAALRPLADDPAVVERGLALHREMDALADAEADDPRIGPLAAALADGLPDGLVDGPVDGPFGEAVLESLAPAQAEVVRRALGLVARR
jgi:DNA-binding transcriptional MerR regulator